MHLERVHPARRQRLGDGREQPERDAHTGHGGRDRVAQRPRDRAEPVRTERDHGRHEREQHPRRAHDRSDDNRDDEREQPERGARQQVRGDQAPGGDVHDGCRFGGIRVDTVDESRDPRAHGARRGARERHAAPLGRLHGGEAPARGETQDVGAHGFGVGGGEVLELHIGIHSRPDDLELRRSQQARDHGPGEVDALHAVERGAPLSAEEHAASHLDVVTGDAEGVEAPRQPEDAEEYQQHTQHDESRHEPQVVLPHVVDGVAAFVLLPLGEAGEEPRDEPVAQVRDDDAHHDDEEQPAAQHGGQRMQPVPFAVAQRRAHLGDGRRRQVPVGCAVGVAGGAGQIECAGQIGPVGCTGRVWHARQIGCVGHRPVRRVSATAMRVSRSCSAPCWLRPGIVTPVAAAAVTSFSCAMPKPRSSGPWVMSTSCMRP